MCCSFWKKNLRFLSQKSKQSTNEALIHAAPPSTNETDVNMQDAKDTANAPGAKNCVPESRDKPVQMETDAKTDAKKIKVKKTNIRLTELVYGRMPPSEVQKAIEKEFEMALQDRVMEEIKDKKNVVKAYVYDMRNKLMTSIRSLLLNQRGKHLLLSFRRWRTGCMKMVKMKPKEFTLPSLRNSIR
ncbi:LOW QUALITY PROTEIN: heat shock 70 kDa protein 15 [Malus sylvestris]|uniref:LOW QUALITY PROTEIN: heat shock 70 kDa protein 15 n=1 Tax=Malus sylvestris TaxID=3752 RepID=UPI0021AC460C|nr:LOW QUALITY PROTEIN: heat shock 70 kDa protein 15 [Malus sylvestris]